MEPVLHRAAALRAAGYNDAAARHVLLLRAALAELGTGAVASHVSAAVMHGLPAWGLALDRAHVTFDRPSGGRLEARLHVHTAPLHADDVVMVHGLAVTSMARTVVDVARRAGFEAAVTVADAALRAVVGDVPARRTEYGTTTATSGGSDSTIGLHDAGGAAAVPRALHAALDAAVRRAKGWSGVPDARRAVAFADGRAESVGESRSRVAIALAGLPPPQLQWPVRCGGSTAYTDFAWPERRTVGEFDGNVKYGRLLRPGQEPGDAVYAEKLREDAIRAQGWEVVRWTWTDLRDFTDTAARIRDRFRG